MVRRVHEALSVPAAVRAGPRGAPQTREVQRLSPEVDASNLQFRPTPAEWGGPRTPCAVPLSAAVDGRAVTALLCDMQSSSVPADC